MFFLMENQNGFLNLNRFDRHPFSFLNCITSVSCRASDNKKEKWKLYSFHNNALFLLSLLLIFASHFVSGESFDGVMVTRSDYQALRSIKHELVDFRGVLRSWNDSGIGACSGGWVGIKCVNGHVIAIQLPWKELGGRISEKIGQLQGLRRISLHDNVLGGSIPVSIGFLPNLRGFYLFNNRLSGSIPPSIGQSPFLQNLDLSNNQLNGTIPPLLLANSTRIYRLNLSYNAIFGSIPPTLTHFPSLTFLSLQHNNLSGPIPNTWSSGLNNQSFQLKSLNLDHNFLSGNIPASLSKLSSLEEINLGNNQIGGIIPYELGSLSRLQLLDLSNNAIIGSFPDTISNLHSLVALNLQGNHLFNQIPENVDRLKNLSVLRLSGNKFNGPIPATIGNLSSLTQLDLSRNNFTGDIPKSVADLKNLSSFDVSYNNLSGSVPSALLKKFNSSSFVGNVQLCGYSISTPCPSSSPSSSPPPQVLPSPFQGSSKRGHRKLRTKDIILIAAGALLVVLLILCCFLLCCLIRKKARSKSKKGKTAISMPAPVMGPEIESGETGGKLVHFVGPFVFTADDLLCATAEIMGKSTYGTAYKATLEDGNQVAVKRLREKVTKAQKEFETEVAELGKIRHANILALRAYYCGPKGEKLLVFDYMPHGSLASFLHARGPETTIHWPTRMNIIMGITRGLCYLHNEENIVHGNLTSSNVLLDEQNNPTIADVALSRLMTSAANTNVIATAGTLGYRAPELSKLKNATEKTDVYSLGVIMLELLTGKSPSEGTDGVDLPQWVASIVKEEWTNEVFDLELMGDSSNVGDELLNTLKLALHCVEPSPAERPEAQQVLEKLEEIKPELAQSSAAEVPAKSE